jgi:hypothetical protein
MVVRGVVFGSGGVTSVVGIVAWGDGCGREELGVTRGVPGVGTTGEETVPVTGGGKGTGMLTWDCGPNGAPARVEGTVGPAAVTAVPEMMVTPEPPVTPPGDIVVVRTGVAPGTGVNPAAGPA